MAYVKVVRPVPTIRDMDTDVRSRRWRMECSAAGLFAVVWLLAIITAPGGETIVQAVSNVGLVVAALLGAAGAAGAARRHTGRLRRTWNLLGASALSWGLGQLAWTLYESVLGSAVPFPSVADVGYLTAVPLAAAALLLLPTGAQSLAGRVRTVLDGLMVAGSLLLISWQIGLRSLYYAGADNLLSHVIALAYPVGDVVMVTIVAYVALQVRHTHGATRFPLRLVGAGLVATAIADSGFAYLALSETYASGSIIDTGWLAGYLLLFAASRKPGTDLAVDEDAPVTQRPIAILMPYVAVIVAMLTSGVELLREGSLGPFVSWNRSFIVMALILRQALTVMENFSLTRRLEARVAERTAELRASQRRFEALVQHSSDVITITDAGGIVRYQSESVQRVFGYRPDELVGRSLTVAMEPVHAAALIAALDESVHRHGGVMVVELPIRHRNGRSCHAEVTITNLLATPSVGGLVLNMRDVSERKQLEEQLVHQAFHDSLTSLANRALFRDRVEQALRRSADGPSDLAVLFLDLDGFKEVNDSLGHACGDLLLIEVAERLHECLRPSDTVARFGGDEFAVLLEDPNGELDPARVAHRITQELQRPFVIDGREVHVRGSLGVATTLTEAQDADQLLRNADLAMYRAKAAGDGSYAEYDPSMHAGLVERLQTAGELRQALERQEFVLHYQPIISLESGELVGLEALVRWQHPARGLVPPAEFIGVAEDIGLIDGIGRWVLFEGCRQLAAWQEAHPTHRPLHISVNISGRQLQHPELFSDIQRALEVAGLTPEQLVLEMTESVIMEYTEENLALLRRLRELGVGLAIDDFGTGYSSLSYLHQFPVDILKIDRSFVERLTASPRDAELVYTILRLGQGLRMMTVAEGIEDHEQMLALLRLNCDLGQGFHFARPLPAEDIERMLVRADVGQHEREAAPLG